MTFEEIENQASLVNEMKCSAKSDDEWMEFNTEWIKLGRMIREFGAVNYNREKTINILLKEE